MVDMVESTLIFPYIQVFINPTIIKKIIVIVEMVESFHLSLIEIFI